MKHSFTDQQLTDAYEAALKEGPCGNTPADYMRAVVNHLPEPATDDWQECRWVDYRPGDRIMRESDRSTIVYKSPIRAVNEFFVELEDKNVHHFQTGITYYRIPAPVQHPDPEVHAVIIVSGAYDVEWDHAYAYVSDGAGYNLVEPINNDSRLLPEAIHNWTPGKVVEDDR